MPNTTSAKKELRKATRRQARHDLFRDELSLIIKKVRKAVTAADEGAAREALKVALQALDKAGKVGILKKNTRDRKKSRLHKTVNALSKKKK